MGPQILIVDDIPSNLNFISDILYNEGFRIIVATNGADAIETAKMKLPDLILLDIAMPMLDGFEVCKILKADTLTSDIPIIFLTAKVDYEDIIKGFEAGAVDFVPKPFNSAELISRVNTHIELKKKTEELKYINQFLEEKVTERTAQLEESNINLKKANQKLSKAYEDLTKLDKAKNEFIRHINHELRTPLQGINGFLKILSDTVHSSEEKDYVTMINTLVSRLVKLSELSLLFSELKTNNYKLDLIPIPVIECVELVREKTDLLEKAIIVEENIDSSLKILADKNLLFTCINIIFDNAVKFSPNKSTICIKSFEKEGKVFIEIIDKGPGFSKKAMEQLFELFSTDNFNYQYEGFGIGLATAKIILDFLSAKMEVINQDNGGAKVSLIFNNLNQS